MDKKMNLGGAGPNHDQPRKRPTEAVQVVGPEQAAIKPGKKDPLDGCCSASPVKAKGM